MGILPELGYQDFEAHIKASERQTMQRMPSATKIDKVHQGRMQKSAG
jgi:hypothetical protein